MLEAYFTSLNLWEPWTMQLAYYSLADYEDKGGFYLGLWFDPRLSNVNIFLTCVILNTCAKFHENWTSTFSEIISKVTNDGANYEDSDSEQLEWWKTRSTIALYRRSYGVLMQLVKAVLSCVRVLARRRARKHCCFVIGRSQSRRRLTGRRYSWATYSER